MSTHPLSPTRWAIVSNVVLFGGWLLQAEVAREAVLEFPHDAMEISAKHGNIKSTEYNLEFFQSFAIVLNALDIGPETMYTCIASSGGNPEAGEEAGGGDLHGHTMPSLMRR